MHSHAVAIFAALPAVFCGLAGASTSNDTHFDVLDYIDPLIGTANGGNIKPWFASVWFVTYRTM